MNIAWIGPPPGAASPSGAYRDALLPFLRERARVELYVEPGREQPDAAEPTQPVSALRPREYDQVVYAFRDEPELAFALAVLRLVGGTVLLEGLELGGLARAAFPELGRGGARAALAVLREGGLGELRGWRARRGAEDRLAGLSLNRSVVRHADAFVVRDEDAALRIRIDRNAHTPIGVMPPCAPEEEARRLLEHFERFPHARRSRRPLVLAALRTQPRGRG